jgi:OOP family OmpA-OmpF porin
MIRLKALQVPSGKSELDQKSQALLEKVEDALVQVRPSHITIEGHTDSLGQSDFNKELSEKRAHSVGQFLTAKGKILRNKIHAVGLGASEPVSENTTPHGRSENRRIDMIIETE